MVLQKRNLSNISENLNYIRNIVNDYCSSIMHITLFSTEIFYNYTEYSTVASIISRLDVIPFHMPQNNSYDIAYLRYIKTSHLDRSETELFYPVTSGQTIDIYNHENGSNYYLAIHEEHVGKWLRILTVYNSSTSVYEYHLEEVLPPDIYLDVDGVINQVYANGHRQIDGQIIIGNNVYRYNEIYTNLHLTTDSNYINNIISLFNNSTNNDDTNNDNNDNNTDNPTADTASVETLLTNIAKVVQEADNNYTAIKGTDLPIRIRNAINNGSGGNGTSNGIIPTGIIRIIENGTHDVSPYAQAVVNVPTNTISGTITLTSNGTHTVAGYENAIVEVPEPSGTKYITSNGDYNITNYANVNVNVSTGGSSNVSGTITITTNGTHNISSYATAIVNVPSTASGTQYITSNGDYDISTYATVSVNVPTSTVSDTSVIDSIVNRNVTSLNVTATSIGQYAFYACSSLRNITGNFNSIDQYAFYGCSSLSQIDLSNVTIIGQYAFHGCMSLRNIDISKVSNMSSNAFQNSGIAITECLANSIGSYAFQGCNNLIDISLPNINGNVQSNMFQNCSNLKVVRIPKAGKFYADVFSDCPKLEAVIVTQTSSVCNPYTTTASVFPFDNSPNAILYVDSSMLDSYKSSSYYTSNNFTDRIKPIEDWYIEPLKSITFINTNTKTIQLALHDFTNIPTVDVSLSTPGIANLGNVSVTKDSISIDITATGTLGTTTLTIRVSGDYSKEMLIPVSFVEFTEPTYTVENISTTYTFELNADGYYESNNKNKDSSYALAKLTYNSTMADNTTNMIIDCISSGESTFDFGILSIIDKTLTDSATEDTSASTVYKSFKGLASYNVQPVVYEGIPSGEHFIYIKYKKDGSSSQDNDSLQFKVRFEIAA